MSKIQTALLKGLVVFFIAAFAISCSTRNVSIQLLVPAEITIPQEISSIGVLNRSLPDKEQQLLNVLEGFVTGESVLADREGSFNCIRGVEEKLRQSPRIRAVAIESDKYRGTGTRQFPELLDWRAVEDICRQYGVDAILALETFDSDFEIRKRTSRHKEKVNGREVTRTEHHADLRVDVGSGWRLYDPIHRKIIDQVNFNDRKEWSGSGKTEQEALDDLPSKRHSINESGRFAGVQLANRISPNWRTESRTFFVKGNDALKDAKTQVRYNNWDAAIVIWKKLAESNDSEIAGKACYNLALASEMKGNIDLAIVWAEKAMKNYHIRKARNYVAILHARKSNEEILREQMKE